MAHQGSPPWRREAYLSEVGMSDSLYRYPLLVGEDPLAALARFTI